MRKFIHGPCVDEPICMIDVADSNAVYYYHYDSLGSVVALSNSSGDSCYSYEYSAFGRVAASDPNFIANPYLFTGRRFDYETGLYYYRARYYNPYIGRFLQTDPIGYGSGINWYLYCFNNPLSLIDSTGREPQRPDTVGGYNSSERPWEREDGHPNPPYYYPYYIQQKNMSCSAAAVLNWWLTYDIGLPKNWLGGNAYGSDAEAEAYVRGQLAGPDHDWDNVGIFDLSKAGDVANNLVGADGNPASFIHHENAIPTIDNLINTVDAGRAAMISVKYGTPVWDSGEFKGYTNVWEHVVLIVPTLNDLDNMVCEEDPTKSLSYSVITGFSGSPLSFDLEGFKAWYKSLAGVRSEWLEGGKVPGR